MRYSFLTIFIFAISLLSCEREPVFEEIDMLNTVINSSKRIRGWESLSRRLQERIGHSKEMLLKAGYNEHKHNNCWKDSTCMLRFQRIIPYMGLHIILKIHLVSLP